MLPTIKIKRRRERRKEGREEAGKKEGRTVVFLNPHFHMDVLFSYFFNEM